MNNPNFGIEVKIPATRIVAREGVNTVQVFFENAGCIFPGNRAARGLVYGCSGPYQKGL